MLNGRHKLAPTVHVPYNIYLFVISIRQDDIVYFIVNILEFFLFFQFK